MKKLIIFIICLLAICITAVATAQEAVSAAGTSKKVSWIPTPETWAHDTLLLYNLPLKPGEQMRVIGNFEESFISISGTKTGLLVKTLPRLKINLESLANELRVLPDWFIVEVVDSGVSVKIGVNKNPNAALRLLTTILSGTYGYVASYEQTKECARASAALRERISELERRN